MERAHVGLDDVPEAMCSSDARPNLRRTHFSFDLGLLESRVVKRIAFSRHSLALALALSSGSCGHAQVATSSAKTDVSEETYRLAYESNDDLTLYKAALDAHRAYIEDAD